MLLPAILSFGAVSILNGILLLLSYIVNNTFPQPLSEEEENKYVALMLQGERTPATPLPNTTCALSPT